MKTGAPADPCKVLILTLLIVSMLLVLNHCCTVEKDAGGAVSINSQTHKLLFANVEVSVEAILSLNTPAHRILYYLETRKRTIACHKAREHLEITVILAALENSKTLF